MDNLAHTLAAGVVSGALLPETTRHFKKRTFLAAAAIANLPDLDFLLTLFGKEFYYFQHRGLTHSLTGLLFIFPACVWIFNRIMRPALLAPLHAGGVSANEKYFFIAVQIFFTHFFLDYLTTYGTMFLYPFSFMRFSFPLMFIIDPLFWLVTGVGFLWLCLSKTPDRKAVLIPAWSCLAALFILWGVEGTFRSRAAAFYQENSQTGVGETSELNNYPGPGAPLFWIIAEKVKGPEGNVHYRQAGISWFKGNEDGPFFWQEPVPSLYRHQAFCWENNFTSEAREAFESYARWGSPLVCGPWVHEEEEGCRCLSLKYSLVALDAVAYGAWWVNQKGDKHLFLDRAPVNKLLEFYRLFLPLPEQPVQSEG